MQQIRGIMLDSARCLENRSYYRQAISFLAQRGVNTILWHFTDDQGCTLAFESVPGIASPNAYSKAEMRELIAFAASLGVTIIPELASLGHTRFITRLPEFKHLDEIENVFTGMCPVAPQTREVLSKLLDEVLDVFDSQLVHVGLDEANIGSHPLTFEALKRRTKAQIVADHINFLHAKLAQAGRRMVMWGDGLLHDRAIAPLIPRDIVICDWQYGANVPPETVQYFLDEGFDLLLCPALVCFGQTMLPGDQLAISNLRSILRHSALTGKGKILGTIETVWQPERYMHDAHWMALDLAAAMLREGPDVSIDDCTRRFAEEFYGLAATDDWVEACRQVYRLAPLRAEWLALVKMDTRKLPAAEEISAKAAAWRQVRHVLAESAHHITRHRVAYETFQLAVRVLAHLYEKAELLQGEGGPSSMSRLLREERLLVEEVDAVWDRERFANDPKKYTPAREVMRDNHLVIVLRESLQRTQEMVLRATTRPRAAEPMAAGH